jgi:flavin-dependent dehydrogenase
VERRPIVIVGSGPAGTATALALHRIDPALAAEVVLLEKAEHPRPKVCAGGVIPAGRRWLAEHDVPFDVPHASVERALVTTPRAAVAHHDRGLCDVVRRAEFDAALVMACRARGIEVRERCRVAALVRDGDGVVIETGTGTLRAALVIGADGSGSIVRRRLFAERGGAVGRAVMVDVPIHATRWSGFAERRYDFDFRPLVDHVPGYLWAFPCLIGGMPHANIGAYSLRPIGAALDQALTRYLGALTDIAPGRCAFPIRWYRPGTAVAAPRALLVGDAAGVDPLMGEGISLAFEYGSLAAATIARTWTDGGDCAAAYQAAFDRSWLAAKLRRLYLATRLFYGATWPLWFGLAERSRRVRSLGLRWYNGVDGWDRRSGWSLLASLVRSPASTPDPAASRLH